MEEYRLEDHLKECSEKYPRYENLYATWNLNKETCINALKSVSINYTHFSEHDASHSQTIIDKIEMLLGDRIKNLSPTDTWLILHAAYTHDLGMLLKMKDLEEAWKSEEFKEFLEQARNGIDEDLKEAIEAIYNLRESKIDYYDSLKIYRYVNLINQCYFRRKHSNISEQYLTSLGENLKVDLTCNGRINANLFYLLGEICGLHTANENEILKLDYKTNGFSTDYAHPRFVAVLLRLGDLLDIDNGRFNPFTALVAGDPPEQTKPHIEKHQSTRHLLITPEKIEFRSNCSSDEAYREIRNTIKWLEKEIEFLTLNWSKIVPKNLGGYAPRFDKKELLLNGIPDIEGTTDLKLQISQEKAFDIIEGYNIYDDKFIFIREVIQNALDATKLKLWQDLNSGFYNSWIKNKRDSWSDLQPYDLPEEIYENYFITINLNAIDNNIIEFNVIDRGIGLDILTFKQLCNVGSSNKDFKDKKKIIKSMPKWLRPTAGFGIGLQSIFLITDKFEIETNASDNPLIATIYANKKGSYIQLKEARKNITRGTKIKILIKENTLINTKEDIFINMLDSVLDAINNSLKKYCNECLFPIKIFKSKKEVLSYPAKIPTINMTRFDWIFDMKYQYCDEIPSWYKSDVVDDWRENEKYYYSLSSDLAFIKIWDKKEHIYLEYRFIKNDYMVNRVYMSNGAYVFFKGIKVKDIKVKDLFKVSTKIDIYGKEAKDIISLSRNDLLKLGYKYVLDKIIDVYCFYKNLLIDEINSLNEENLKKLNEIFKYHLWLNCNKEERKKLRKDILRSCSKKVSLLKNNELSEISININEIIEKKYFIKYAYLSLNKTFNDLTSEGFYIKDKVKDLDIDIICDNSFYEVAKQYNIGDLKYIGRNYNLNGFFLYKITEDDDYILDIEENAKMVNISLLSQNTLFPWKRLMSNGFCRYCILAFKEYEILAVKFLNLTKVSRNIIGSGIINDKSWVIISPFNIKESYEVFKKNKEEFLKLIMNSDSFCRIVDYVKDNSIKKDTINKKDIINKYKKLIEEFYDIMQKYKKVRINGFNK